VVVGLRYKLSEKKENTGRRIRAAAHDELDGKGPKKRTKSSKRRKYLSLGKVMKLEKRSDVWIPSGGWSVKKLKGEGGK